MKNFNIFEFHWGGVTKNQYIVGDCLKRWAWTVCRSKGERGRVGKKEGVVFLGWLIPPYTLWSILKVLWQYFKCFIVTAMP